MPEEQVLFSGDMFISSNYLGFSINKINEVKKVIALIDNILKHKDGVKWIISTHTEIIPGEDLEKIRNLIVTKYNELDPRKSAVLYLQHKIERARINIVLKELEIFKPDFEKAYYFSEKELNLLGYRLMGNGQNDEAIKLFKWFTENHSKSANAYDNLGEAYLRNGNIQLAIENYKKSLDIFPANRNAEGILEILQK